MFDILKMILGIVQFEPFTDVEKVKKTLVFIFFGYFPKSPCIALFWSSNIVNWVDIDI